MFVRTFIISEFGAQDALSIPNSNCKFLLLESYFSSFLPTNFPEEPKIYFILGGYAPIQPAQCEQQTKNFAYLKNALFAQGPGGPETFSQPVLLTTK